MLKLTRRVNKASKEYSLYKSDGNSIKTCRFLTLKFIYIEITVESEVSERWNADDASEQNDKVKMMVVEEPQQVCQQLTENGISNHQG